MLRECMPVLAVAGCTFLGGCEVLLKFDEKPVPIDAPIDAPYTQEECDYKEPNDSLETAQVVTSADTGPAAICAKETDDHDFYKFTVPAGTTMVTVDVTFMNRSTGDLDLRLYDSTGAVKAQSRGFGNEEKIVCPAVSPQCDALTEGDYTFEVFPALAGFVNTYNFALTVQ